jgi:hypothetical protein
MPSFGASRVAFVANSTARAGFHTRRSGHVTKYHATLLQLSGLSGSTSMAFSKSAFAFLLDGFRQVGHRQPKVGDPEMKALTGGRRGETRPPVNRMAEG